MFANGEIEDGVLTINFKDELIVGLIVEGKYRYVRVNEDRILVPTKNCINIE
mgnify:CR=1 FL=1